MTTTTRNTRRATTRAANPDTQLDWRQQAACTGMDGDLFFPVGFNGEAWRREQAAKEVCAVCPVRAVCLDWAVRTRQYSGVWGGLSERERRPLYEEPERSFDRCLSEQEWIEAQLADGRSRKSIAHELGVDRAVLSRAIARMSGERDTVGMAGMEAAA